MKCITTGHLCSFHSFFYPSVVLLFPCPLFFLSPSPRLQPFGQAGWVRGTRPDLHSSPPPLPHLPLCPSFCPFSSCPSPLCLYPSFASPYRPYPSLSSLGPSVSLPPFLVSSPPCFSFSSCLPPLLPIGLSSFSSLSLPLLLPSLSLPSSLSPSLSPSLSSCSEMFGGPCSY